MDIRFSILSSGSTGNVTIIEMGECRLLLDVGLSVKRVEQLLIQQGVPPATITGILITHEHADHVRGLGSFARKYKVPVYANHKTWNALESIVGDMPEKSVNILHTGEMLHFGQMKVESFPISHDAVDPVAYNFMLNGQKLSIVTDTGYMSPAIRDKIREADVLVIEANHDIQMLRVGKYPWNVKRRILSDLGHLSNEAAGEALCEIITAKTKRVYLAHLSQQHNMMDLAKLTVHSIIYENQINTSAWAVELKETYPNRSTAWDDLGEVESHFNKRLLKNL